MAGCIMVMLLGVQRQPHFWTKKRGDDDDDWLKQSCLEQSRQPWLVGLNRAEKVGVTVGVALRAYPNLCCSLLNFIADVG